jgi:hypothetical protein
MHLTRRGVATGCALVAIGVVACGHAPRDLEHRSDALILLPGARNIAYHDWRDVEGRPTSETVSYQVLDVLYPAKDAVCRISGEVGRQGWHPLERVHGDEPNTSEPSSYAQGWRYILIKQGTPEEFHAYRWDADWANNQGDRLTYSLAYGYWTVKPDAQRLLQVFGAVTAARTLSSREQAAIYTGTLLPHTRPHLTPTEDAGCLTGSAEGGLTRR